MRNSRTSRRPSQKDAVLNHLTLGGEVDAMSAQRLCRCVRLAAIIHLLKADGHEITKRTVVQNDGARLATYSLT